MNLIISTNFTPDPLRRLLKSHSIHTGAFNDYRVILSGGALAEPTADGILFLLDGNELALEHGFVPERLMEAVSWYAEACIAFAKAHPSLLVLASILRLPSFPPDSFSNGLESYSYAAIEGNLRATLFEASTLLNNLFVFDFARLIGYVGEQAAFNSGMRYFGRFSFSPALLNALDRHLGAFLNAIYSRSRKVLAIDFDDTLWGGILGEVGSLGVIVGREGKGLAYSHFQAALKRLMQRGVLLVGLSKNNPRDVEELFSSNDMMVLCREDFALIYANWEEKAKNIQLAAKTLNLGLDSFVFIDDNPVERAAMRELLPQVAVPDHPSSPDRLPAWLCDEVIPLYFPAYYLTREDINKADQYKANIARSQLQQKVELGDFIRNLQIDLELRADDLSDAQRLSQMTQKTNQFNLTTRRLSAVEVESMIRDTSFRVISLRYRDRFGDEGVVGLAIINLVEANLHTFLLSCRVIGREVDRALMEEVIRHTRGHGLKELRASFIPTKKNQVCKEFLPSCEFVLESTSPESITYTRSI